MPPKIKAGGKGHGPAPHITTLSQISKIIEKFKVEWRNTGQNQEYFYEPGMSLRTKDQESGRYSRKRHEIAKYKPRIKKREPRNTISRWGHRRFHFDLSF